MPTVVACPNCGISGTVPDESPEGVLRCPNCEAHFPRPTGQTPIPNADPNKFGVWVGPPGAVPPASAVPNAPEITPETAAGYLDWIRNESRRFDAYISAQFARLGKRQEELARAEVQAASDALGREMALSRDRAVLDAQAAALGQREAEWTARLAVLERREAEVARAEQAVQQRLIEVEEVEQAVREESRAAAVTHVRQVLAKVAGPSAHGCG